MSDFRIAISTENKPVAVEKNRELGQMDDGSVVHEIFNCPQEAQFEDIAFLISKSGLKADTYRHNFADLASGGSSCCGQCS